MSAENIFALTALVSKQQIDAQADSAQLEVQREKNAKALAEALDELEQNYIEQERATNQKQAFKLLISEHTKPQAQTHATKKGLIKTFQALTKKLPFSKEHKQLLQKVIKNPQAFGKQDVNLKSQLEKLSSADITKAIQLANNTSTTIDPQEILTSLQNLAQGSNLGDNYLMEMAKASQALAETMQVIAQTDVEMQKVDNETIQDQIKNLQTMLTNIKQDTNDQVSAIKKQQQAEFWKKFALCFVAAVMIVVGAIASIAGGAGMGLIVAGVVMMASTLASQYIDKGTQDLAGQFTKNPQEREKIAAGISIAVTTAVTVTTAVVSCGTSLAGTAVDGALMVAGNVIKGAGEGLAMGASAFSMTGGAEALAYEMIDTKYKGVDVRNDGTAQQQEQAEKIMQTIGYVTMAIGAVGGLMTLGGAGLVKLGTKAAAGAIEDGSKNSIEMSELDGTGSLKNNNISTEIASDTLQRESEQNQNLAIKAIKQAEKTSQKLAPKAPTFLSKAGNFVNNKQWAITGGSHLAGNTTATVFEVRAAEAGLAAAYARLFASLDETTFNQGTKSIEMAQQGWEEDQTAIEAQTVGQVQQEGVRTNIEQDAMIQQAKIIASIRA